VRRVAASATKERRYDRSWPSGGDALSRLIAAVGWPRDPDPWLAGRSDGSRIVTLNRQRLALALVGTIAALMLGACGGASGGPTASSAARDVSFQHVDGPPFGVVATRDGRYAFLDLLPGHVLVYSTRGTSAPRLIRSISVPGEAVGSSLTRDGRLLLIANRQGATVVSVARAERGMPDPVLGILMPPASAHVQAGGAIETASSADGRYVFVSLEYGQRGGVISVYRIGSTAAARFGASDYVGSITLGLAVVGSALSPDGKYLYVTSELADRPAAQTLFKAGQTLAQRIKSQSQPRLPDGSLSVINVAIAERDPAHAVLATVSAMQQPVRVAVSPSGAVVWVTARASDRLLAFSAAKLLTDSAHARLASVRVGAAPVGVAVSPNGNRVIVADSNRFSSRGAHAAITVVDAHAALTHRSAILATLPAGQFPREIAVEPDGVALISNFASDQVETIDLPRVH
jgi:DNA-binding beta-propeller fold protein YncE